MNQIVIIINGSGGVGKDQFIIFFEGIINKELYTIYNISTIDPVRKIIPLLGIPENKNEKLRKFMSDVKDTWSECFDGPFMYIIDKVSDIMGNHSKVKNIPIVFVHSREPNEINRFKNCFSAIGIYTTTLLIKRPGYKIESNHADANVDNYIYDNTIYNDNSLISLMGKVKNYYNEITKDA